jgi:helix-turn-helix protein
VLENNTLHFSKIGQASAYLINKENDVIEITENNEKMETFEFISSGILSNTEKVIFSNIRLE